MKDESKGHREVTSKEDFLGFFIVLFIIFFTSGVFRIYSSYIEKHITQLKF